MLEPGYLVKAPSVPGEPKTTMPGTYLTENRELSETKKIQLKARVPESLRELLQLRSIKERREMQEIIQEAIETYLKVGNDPTEVDILCAKLRRLLSVKNPTDLQAKAIAFIKVFLEQQL